MYKNVLSSVAILSLSLVTTACGFSSPESIAPVSDSVGGVVDAGVIPLPTKPGYQLHSYVVLRKMNVQHYVYILEKDGVPVVGTDAAQTINKNTVTVSSSLDSSPQIKK